MNTIKSKGTPPPNAPPVGTFRREEGRVEGREEGREGRRKSRREGGREVRRVMPKGPANTVVTPNLGYRSCQMLAFLWLLRGVSLLLLREKSEARSEA